MLNHSCFIELLWQIFTDLHPKYVVQCCGGDALKAPKFHLASYAGQYITSMLIE
jgi:hypothetical protein